MKVSKITLEALAVTRFPWGLEIPRKSTTPTYQEISRHFIQHCEVPPPFISMYSGVPNNRGVWNN